MKKLTDREKFLANAKLEEKHFADGMYAFSMFMVEYFSRVQSNLKIDYESFMIVQITITHVIYQSKKKADKNAKNYLEMESLWDEAITKYAYRNVLEESEKSSNKMKSNKLTISSICLILNLPKETVRRKIINLTKKKILNYDNKLGVNIGEGYKKIFSDFVPTTILKLTKMIKIFEKTGALKALLNLNTKDL
jgi:hypothetical protein